MPLPLPQLVPARPKGVTHRSTNSITMHTLNIFFKLKQTGLWHSSSFILNNKHLRLHIIGKHSICVCQQNVMFSLLRVFCFCFFNNNYCIVDVTSPVYLQWRIQAAVLFLVSINLYFNKKKSWMKTKPPVSPRLSNNTCRSKQKPLFWRYVTVLMSALMTLHNVVSCCCSS